MISVVVDVNLIVEIGVKTSYLYKEKCRSALFYFEIGDRLVFMGDVVGI